MDTDEGYRRGEFEAYMWMLERPLEIRKSNYHVAHQLVKACIAAILMSDSWLIG